MIPLLKPKVIKFAYRMMFRPYPVLTGFALATALFSSSSQAGTNNLAGGVRPAVTAALKGVVKEIAAASPTDLQKSATANGSSLTHSPEADERIDRADRHFNTGRQLYFQGNLDGARREFDAAVDALLNAPESLPDHRRIERRLDEIADLIYRFDVEKLGAGQSNEEAVVFDKAPIDEISHMTFQVDESLTPKLKTEVTQTASGIPLELSDPVLSSVHFFSSERGRRILLEGYRRSGRYKALIQRVFAEEGVPQELIYLAQAESGFLPRAVSNKQAVGMWQFIAGTGSRYDLVRTSTYDARLDPEKATHAAAKYLRDLYARYGDWYLAMAAYNCGEGNVDRAVERTGYADYWELLRRHALPKETSAYVPIIVAMTIMAKNPKDYGLDNIDLDPPIEYESIQLTASTNLNLIADASMQPVSEIRDLNPALLAMVAPAGYEVHVPKGAGQTTMAALATVPEANRQAWRLHHVEAGDTLSTIAQSYHTTAERIVAVNQSADSLEAGDLLLIPAAYRPLTQTGVRAHPQHSSRMLVSRIQVKKSATLQRGSHMAASRHVSSPVLHRKAAVRTASLHR